MTVSDPRAPDRGPTGELQAGPATLFDGFRLGGKLNSFKER